MRRLALIMLLASCGEPARPHAPPDVLARMNPNADTSHNPTLKTYGSKWGWGRLFHHDDVPDAFYTPANPPHYYMGCGGCASNDPAGVLGLLALIPALARRRRMRCSTAS